MAGIKTESDSGTELERNWNGIESKDKDETNTTSEQGCIEGDDGSWNGRTEFHGDKDKNESKHKDSSNINNTGQNIQDLQKSNCIGADSTDAILDDNFKTNSVRIASHFRSKFLLVNKQQNNQYPIRIENSVRQLHGGSN